MMNASARRRSKQPEPAFNSRGRKRGRFSNWREARGKDKGITWREESDKSWERAGSSIHAEVCADCPNEETAWISGTRPANAAPDADCYPIGSAMKDAKSGYEAKVKATRKNLFLSILTARQNHDVGVLLAEPSVTKGAAFRQEGRSKQRRYKANFSHAGSINPHGAYRESSSMKSSSVTSCASVQSISR